MALYHLSVRGGTRVKGSVAARKSDYIQRENQYEQQLDRCIYHEAVCERALARGHGIRTGLEYPATLPDGQLATDDAKLFQTALALRHRAIYKP